MFSALLSQLLPGQLGLRPKGDAIRKVLEPRYWPGGRLGGSIRSPSMAGVDVSQGSQGFGTGIFSDLGGTAKDISWEVLGWD